MTGCFNTPGGLRAKWCHVGTQGSQLVPGDSGLQMSTPSSRCRGQVGPSDVLGSPACCPCHCLLFSRFHFLEWWMHAAFSIFHNKVMNDYEMSIDTIWCENLI